MILLLKVMSHLVIERIHVGYCLYFRFRVHPSSSYLDISSKKVNNKWHRPSRDLLLFKTIRSLMTSLMMLLFRILYGQPVLPGFPCQQHTQYWADSFLSFSCDILRTLKMIIHLFPEKIVFTL